MTVSHMVKVTCLVDAALAGFKFELEGEVRSMDLFVQLNLEFKRLVGVAARGLAARLRWRRATAGAKRAGALPPERANGREGEHMVFGAVRIGLGRICRFVLCCRASSLYPIR